MSPIAPEIDAALRLLAESANYRVLERLPNADVINRHLEDKPVTAIAIDVETTGLDVEVDDVIELGMIKFTFSRTGEIGRVLDRFRSLNQPSYPITAGE